MNDFVTKIFGVVLGVCYSTLNNIDGFIIMLSTVMSFTVHITARSMMSFFWCNVFAWKDQRRLLQAKAFFTKRKVALCWRTIVLQKSFARMRNSYLSGGNLHWLCVIFRMVRVRFLVRIISLIWENMLHLLPSIQSMILFSLAYSHLFIN